MIYFPKTKDFQSKLVNILSRTIIINICWCNFRFIRRCAARITLFTSPLILSLTSIGQPGKFAAIPYKIRLGCSLCNASARAFCFLRAPHLHAGRRLKHMLSLNSELGRRKRRSLASLLIAHCAAVTAPLASHFDGGIFSALSLR